MRKFFGFLWLGFIIFLAIFGLTISLLLGSTLSTVVANLLAVVTAFAAGPYFDLPHIIAYAGALLLIVFLVIWYVRLFKRMKPFMRFLIPFVFLITAALGGAGYLKLSSLLAAYADPATKQLAMYTIGSLGLSIFFGLLLSLTGFFDTFKADYYPRRKADKRAKTKPVATPVAAEAHDGKLVVKEEEPLSRREQKKRDKYLKKHPELAQQAKAEVKVEDPQAELRKLIREELAQFHIIPKHDQIVNVQPTPAPVYVINVPVPQPAPQPQPVAQPYPVYPPYPPYYPPYPGYPYPPYPPQPQGQPAQPQVQPPVSQPVTPQPSEPQVVPQPAPVVSEPEPIQEDKPEDKVEEPIVPVIEKPLVDETIDRAEVIAAKRREEKHKPTPQKIEKVVEVNAEPIVTSQPEKPLEPVAEVTKEDSVENIVPVEPQAVETPTPEQVPEVVVETKPAVQKPKPIIEEVTVYEEPVTEPIVKVVEVVKIVEPAPKPVQKPLIEEAMVEEKVVVKEEKPVEEKPVEVKPEPKPEPIPEPEPEPVVETKPVMAEVIQPIVEEKPEEDDVEEDEEDEEEMMEAVVEEKPRTPLDILLAEEKAEESIPMLDKKPTPKLMNKPKQKVIRLPFETKLLKLDKDVLAKYNELKNYILAFGLGSRVSNAGDTFRLHKKMYVRITVAGKGLKLYYALDPKKYQDSTIPVQDASNKGLYEEIPLVFKVKSDLSMKRAKMLVDDVMAANGFAQGNVENIDYIAELRSLQ